MLDAGFGIGALLVADHHDRAAAEPRQPADDGGVLGVGAVASQGREFFEQPFDAVDGMRPLGVARHLNLVPGGELGVGLAQQAVRLGLQLTDFLGDADVAVGLEVPKFLDLAFELGDGFFEIKILGHWFALVARQKSASKCLAVTEKSIHALGPRRGAWTAASG